jgi:hypothetical protein
MALIRGKCHYIEDYSTKDSKVNENLNKPEPALAWC